MVEAQGLKRWQREHILLHVSWADTVGRMGKLTMFPLWVPMIYTSLANLNKRGGIAHSEHTILSPPTTKLLVASPLR